MLPLKSAQGAEVSVAEFEQCFFYQILYQTTVREHLEVDVANGVDNHASYYSLKPAQKFLPRLLVALEAQFHQFPVC